MFSRSLCLLRVSLTSGWVQRGLQRRSFVISHGSLQQQTDHTELCRLELKTDRDDEGNVIAPWDISAISLDTASRKPIIFLDVDGVVNNDRGVPWKDQKETTVRGFRISYSPSVVELFNKFHREGLAEIRWLTAWGFYAPEKLAPALGLDTFLTARDALWTPHKGVVAKAIAEACPERPIAWLDDELTGPCGYARRDIKFWKARPRTLLIEPKRHVSKAQMTRLEKFLRNHKV